MFNWDDYPWHDFDAAKQFGSDFYRTLGRVRCPALNFETVAFNSKGICHILYKAAHHQPEIIERLACLQYAAAIIEDAEANIEYRLEHEREYMKEGGDYRRSGLDH